MIKNIFINTFSASSTSTAKTRKEKRKHYSSTNTTFD
jgi:hypothetical protein